MKDDILIILAEVSLHEKDIETAQQELLDLFLVSKRGKVDTSFDALVVKGIEPLEQCNKSKWGDCECIDKCRRGLKK